MTRFVEKESRHMRIGMVIGNPGGFGDSISALRADYERARSEGLATVWMTQHLGLDALTVMASWGNDPGPELGTAVIPAQTRHPVALAEQAVTTHGLSGGRLALGLGLAHSASLESTYGLSSRRSVAYLADYLETVQALMAGEKSTANETFNFSTRIVAADLADPPSVLIAALGPRMLRLAGERTAGTITWMTGPRTIAGYVTPSIRAAADGAGRPEPRVVVCLPFCVTANPKQALSSARFSHYSQLPSYRAMLEREGVDDPIEIATAGDEDVVRSAFERLAAGGATDVGVIPFGNPDEVAATWQLAAACARE
jgi:F420-dependent oxidoreductase-like protein